MTVRRLARFALHREDNDAQVVTYGRALRAIFDDWLRQSVARGLSTPALGGRLQEAAEAHYAPAFLRGKRQALPGSTLSPDDRQWLQRALQVNRTYVQQSLEADIQDKATLQRMQGADVAELGKMFGSRVEQQYGGQLWRVTEAGFRSGVRDLAAAVRARFRLPIHQEDGEDQDDEEADLAAVAAALAISVAALRRILRRAGGSVVDLDVSDSEATQAVASVLDRTPDEIATTATEAMAGAVAGPGPGEADLATALGVDQAEMVDLGAALRRTAGADFRTGTAYRTQGDGDVCGPCVEAGAGGDGTGVYWEPDEPPLPGEECRGRGNCRCYLEAVYEFGGGEDVAA